MADVEEVPVEDQAPAVPAAASTTDALPYDESLLIRVKGKPKKPVKPDEAERNVPVAKLQAEITKYGDRIKEIKDIIDAKRQSGRSVGAGGDDARSRMQMFRQEFQAVLRQKQHIRDELAAANKQRDQLRNESRGVREKTKIIPEHELEERIQKLEFDLSHSSLSASDEKKVSQQLQQYIAQRPLIRQYTLLDAAFKENEAVRADITKRLQDCDQALNDIKAREDVEKAALEGVRAKADQETSDIPSLTEEKKECWEVMQALRDKVTEIRNDFDRKYKEWQKLDRNFNAWQRWDRQHKYEEVRKERAARTEAYKVEEVAQRGEPYESEIYTCDYTLAYLRKFVATEKKVEVDLKPVEAPEGMKLFKRRDIEDDVKFTVAPKKKGNAPKGMASQQATARAAAESAAAAASKAASAAAGPKPVKMNHTLESLKTFMGLGIEAPNTTADIPATIEKVEAKKNHFFELRVKAKEAPPPAAYEPEANGGDEAEPSGTAVEDSGEGAAAVDVKETEEAGDAEEDVEEAEAAGGAEKAEEAEEAEAAEEAGAVEAAEEAGAVQEAEEAAAPVEAEAATAEKEDEEPEAPAEAEEEEKPDAAAEDEKEEEEEAVKEKEEEAAGKEEDEEAAAAPESKEEEAAVAAAEEEEEVTAPETKEEGKEEEASAAPAEEEEAQEEAEAPPAAEEVKEEVEAEAEGSAGGQQTSGDDVSVALEAEGDSGAVSLQLKFA